MKKKTLSILSLIFAVVFAVALAVPAFAATAKVSVGSASGKRGDTVTVTISVSDCDKGSAMGLEMSYDKNVLELVPSQCEWLKDGLMESFDSSTGLGVWASASPISLNGNVCKVVFKIKSGAALGKTTVGCTLQITNGSESVSTTVTKGSVTVECSHPNKVKDTSNAFKKSDANCASAAVYYYKCSDCGVKLTSTFTSGAKNADKHSGGTTVKNRVEPTETSEGYSGDTYCKGCGVLLEKGHTLGKADHVHIPKSVPAKTASCTEDGNIAHYTCSACGKYFSDSACRIEITAESVITKATGHTPDKDASCTEDSVCTVCGVTVAEKTGHTLKAELKEPTCSEGGYSILNCEECEYTSEGTYTYAGTVTVDVNGIGEHAELSCSVAIPSSLYDEYVWKIGEYKLTFKDGKLAVDGLTEGEDYEVAYTDSTSVEHTLGEWITDKEATADENGHAYRACLDCGLTVEEKTLIYSGGDVSDDKPNDEKPDTDEKEPASSLLWIIISAVLALALIAAVAIIIVLIKRGRALLAAADDESDEGDDDDINSNRPDMIFPFM